MARFATHLIAIAKVLGLLVLPIPIATALPLQSPEEYAAAGREAAKNFPGYVSLCDLDARIRNVNIRRNRSGAKQNPNAKRSDKKRRRSRRKAEPIAPTKVFDNLYAFGTSGVLAWLYGNEEGYILIDGLNNDQEAETYILGGMKTLGLDQNAIKYVLVTHAHGDHYGGADLIAEKLGIEIMMSAPDWKLAKRIGNHPRFGPPPKSGLIVKDGQVLAFGNSTLTVNLTPGHTPGTISPIFAVKDGNNTHNAMLWGGTGFNFGPFTPTFLAYADSARKMGELARNTKVEVYLSGHPRRDGSLERIKLLADRKIGMPHPFIRGEAGYALFTVLENCAMAQAARFKSLRK